MPIFNLVVKEKGTFNLSGAALRLILFTIQANLSLVLTAEKGVGKYVILGASVAATLINVACKNSQSPAFR